MSCTVIALPYALMWVVGAIAASATTVIDNAIQEEKEYEIDSLENENCKNCSRDFVITEKHFIEKTFETPFVDKSILLKTLKEHGVKNIYEWENGLSGEVDNYKLIFEKPSEEKPYNIRITCLENANAEEKVGDLSQEYAMNVQEDAYLHIVEKLKDNNMQIEDEEVQDDNTIVLTINIE